MSQVDTYTFRRAPPDYSGAEFIPALEAMVAALGSFNRGPQPPTDPFEGMPWWDTSAAPVETFKRYTGSAGWVGFFSINISTGAILFLIPASMITEVMIGAGAVTADKIAANTVTLSKLARAGSAGDLLSSNGSNSDLSFKSPANLGLMRSSNNLSDLASLATALNNLGFTAGANWVRWPTILGGHMQQWGTATATSAGNTITLPTAFPNRFLHVLPTDSGISSLVRFGAVPVSLGSFTAKSEDAVGQSFSYLAIGD